MFPNTLSVLPQAPPSVRCCHHDVAVLACMAFGLPHFDLILTASQEAPGYFCKSEGLRNGSFYCLLRRVCANSTSRQITVAPNSFRVLFWLRCLAVGSLSKAAKELVSSGIHQLTPSVLEKLKALHPQATLPPSTAAADAPEFICEAAEVEAPLLQNFFWLRGCSLFVKTTLVKKVPGLKTGS